MNVRLLIANIFLFVLASCFVANADDSKLKPTVDFAKQIMPIFKQSCHDCHSAETREAGLRLDKKSAAFGGSDSGLVIKAHKSSESKIIDYIEGKNPEKIMPPEGYDRLTKEQGALVRKWIDEGANWPESADIPTQNKDLHWAYRPLEMPKFSGAQKSQTIVHPIDELIQRKLSAESVKPSPLADRYTLVRRLYFDLIGLPPSIEEVDQFIADTSEEAYEKLVDRLLSSKHFGERWGRHWLDKARYADSDGYEKDRPRPNAWRYRDWVIKAINEDMPFDQFTKEQLAGDMLPDATTDQILASAFNRQTLTNTEGGTDKEQWRIEAVYDRTETLGAVWLGLTVGCARCHSHKYDEISQREYYQLFSFFNNGDETTTDTPKSAKALVAYNQKMKELKDKLDTLKSSLHDAKMAYLPELPEWELETLRKITAEQSKQPVSHLTEIENVKGSAKAKLTIEPSGIVQLESTNQKKAETFVATLATNQKSISGFTLSALTDEKLPRKGPGFATDGNFVLTNVRVVIVDSKNKDKAVKVIPIVDASASFSQKRYPILHAIDSDKKTGWAISPKQGQAHEAIFVFKDLVTLKADQKLQVQLAHNNDKQRFLGRFRIAITTGPIPRNIVTNEVQAILSKSPKERTKTQSDDLLTYASNLSSPLVKRANRDIAKHETKRPTSPFIKTRVIAQRTKAPRQSYVFRRGDFLQPVKELPVKSTGLDVLPPIKIRNPKQGADRIDLANWLTSPQNPIVPRVAANQIWSHLFGEGLVPTMEDFGVRGERPTHPELLDWLALEYMDLGWSRKAVVKRIVNSEAYKRVSAHRVDLVDRDPENKLLYRQNRFRVQAETIRDLYLTSSGLLDKSIGGPSVYPPMPEDIAALSYANNFKWITSQGKNKYRRGMYTFFKRTSAYPNLVVFDCPDSNTTSVSRRISNTPLQALTTLNNEVYVEAAKAMAQRLLKSEFKTDREKLVFGIRLCVSREPSEKEIDLALDLLESSRDWYRNHSEDAKTFVGEFSIQEIPDEETAAWIATSRILMNVDEFITRE